jgi:hypothetical protein
MDSRQFQCAAIVLLQLAEDSSRHDLLDAQLQQAEAQRPRRPKEHRGRESVKIPVVAHPRTG